MIVDFIRFVSRLKIVKRSGWKNKLNLLDCESVADHSYVMTVLGMAIADNQGLNTEKILRMSLLHDLAESITGDIMPEQMPKRQKNIKENNAISKILNELPNELTEKYFAIWNEYQKKETKEAKFIQELDKLEMIIQAKQYQDDGINKKMIKPFIDSATNDIKSDEMKKILKKFISQQ